jgi:ubiquinone/menaquinone biosynthesis C-methylase UbiE
MLSEALVLELEGLSTLQRKLLIELLQRRYPQFWSSFTDHKNSWQRRKETLEEFLQNHQIELVKEFAKAGFSNNGWKTARR